MLVEIDHNSHFNIISSTQLANCVEIGLPMLILLVVCQVIYISQNIQLNTWKSHHMRMMKPVFLLQYLKYLHPRAHPVLERFGLLICIGIIWAFAAILTVGGAYNNVREQTKQSCRTDHSHLISSAPWYWC